MIVFQIALALLMTQSAASVEGVVTRTGTTEPVSKAIVELRNDSDNAVQYTVATADDGRYAFRDVRSGKYRLVVSHSGFVRTEYGQTKASGRGLPIEVNSAQHVAGLQISLMPTGAIHGRIYGPDGQPIIKANVQAMKTSYQNGQRILTPVQTTLTNDLGEYRLFWLAPGQYFVGVNAPNWNRLGDDVTLSSTAATLASPVNGMRFGSLGTNPLAPLLGAGPVASVRYLPVYFPNTTDNQAAQSMDVKPGSDLGGIDIMLSPLKTRRVRGTVIDRETGQPPAPIPGFGSTIFLSPAMDGASNSINSGNGTFDIQVGLGATVLSVAAVTQTGTVAIPAGDADLDDVRIVISAGLKLPGQILIDGVDPASNDPRLPLLRVTLRGDPLIYAISTRPPSGVPSGSGAFTIENVTPGNYRLNVMPILNPAAPALPPALQNAYVKSIRLGDTDVLSDGLQIGTEQPDRPLTIIVGLNPGSISGVVRTEKQADASDVTVVLVPADAAKRVLAYLYRTAVTDASGRYKLDRIPPGNYKLFAWEDVDNGAWQDAQFIRAYEDLGKPVVVAEGSREDMTLSVIPPK